MGLLHVERELVPAQELERLRVAVETATDHERMRSWDSPYQATFWHDLSTQPTNLVERVVHRYLAPSLEEEAGSSMGVEWWLGRLAPPYADNFEFGLHRDFGEHPTTGELLTPAVSSVLYLTTIDDGPLVVYANDPPRGRADDGACEHFFPTANSFVAFPGHLWHTISSRERVLGRRSSADALRLSVTVNWWPFRPASTAEPPMKLVAADYDGGLYPELGTDDASVSEPVLHGGG